MIQQLICHFELDFEVIEQAFTIDFRGYFKDQWPALQAMHDDGLIHLSNQGIQVLPAGRLLVRSVCMVFDAYLGLHSQQRFSRVI
ncbi:Oxygen-independent coproporphyrinogen-III oxidase [compost metagenome]